MSYLNPYMLMIADSSSEQRLMQEMSALRAELKAAVSGSLRNSPSIGSVADAQSASPILTQTRESPFFWQCAQSSQAASLSHTRLSVFSPEGAHNNRIADFCIHALAPCA